MIVDMYSILHHFARSTLTENYNKMMKVPKTTPGNEMEEAVFSSEKITFKKKREINSLKMILHSINLIILIICLSNNI